MNADILYFAYGSNLLGERLRRRVPSARVVGPARLDGYAMRFNLLSGDGSAKCNIVPREDAHVWGVAWTLPRAEREGLDRAEGLGIAYDEHTVAITVADGMREALTYVGRPERLGAAAAPYGWYKAFVLAGALEHALDPHYVSEHVVMVDHKTDHDVQRHRDNVTIVHSAGVLGTTTDNPLAGALMPLLRSG